MDQRGYQPAGDNTVYNQNLNYKTCLLRACEQTNESRYWPTSSSAAASCSTAGSATCQRREWSMWANEHLQPDTNAKTLHLLQMVYYWRSWHVILSNNLLRPLEQMLAHPARLARRRSATPVFPQMAVTGCTQCPFNKTKTAENTKP